MSDPGLERRLTLKRRIVVAAGLLGLLVLGMEDLLVVLLVFPFAYLKERAAHLLGYVGVDGTGLEGLEWAYDSQIRGRPGAVLIHTDAKRHAFSRFERPPTAGSTIELTIDEYLQHVAERELQAGIAEH